jgi:hypothetical protein
MSPVKESAKLKEAKAKAPIGSTAQGRCMKDKAQVDFVVEEHAIWSNGMVVAVGKCSCGTTVNRILGKS